MLLMVSNPRFLLVTHLKELSAGGTQVKWNRNDGNILASSHLDEVLIWDRRVSCAHFH